MAFAENLRRSREAAGLSQMELCRRSGISIDSLRNWEQDRVLPRLDSVVKLARALGVSLDALAEGMEVVSTEQDHAQAGPSASAKRTTGGQAEEKARPKRVKKRKGG